MEKLADFSAAQRLSVKEGSKVLLEKVNGMTMDRILERKEVPSLVCFAECS